MTTNDHDPLVEVFGGTPWEAEIVKGLLESNHIPAMLEDDTMGSITSPYAGLGGDMKVLVDKADLSFARQLIDNRDKENRS